MTAKALLFLVVVVGAFAQMPPPWVPEFESAFKELRTGNVDDAQQRFERLWASHPHDAQLATSIGGALDSASRHDQAAGWYQKALGAHPDYEPALNNLALNFALRGRLSDAAVLLRKIWQGNPQNTKAAYNLGLIDMRLRRYDEAAKALQAADASPELPAPREQIRLAEATAFFHLGRYGEAARCMEGAPQSAEEVSLLGSAQALSGNVPEAVTTLQRGAARFPKEAQIYFRLALVFAEGRRDQDAESVVGAGLKEIPNSPLLAYARAVLADMAGRDDEAIEWARKSISFSEQQPEVWGLLGVLYDRRGRTDESVAAYQRALELGAGPYIGAKYAEALIRLNRGTDAAAVLKRLGERFPSDSEVNRALGKLFRSEDQFEKAEAHLRKSLQENGADPQAHYALAQVLEHQGRAEEAKKEFALYKAAKEKSETVRILERVEN